MLFLTEKAFPTSSLVQTQHSPSQTKQFMDRAFSSPHRPAEQRSGASTARTVGVALEVVLIPSHSGRDHVWRSSL